MPFDSETAYPPVPLAPGALLVAPADAGLRAADVLCVFDRDPDEPDALYALVLNQSAALHHHSARRGNNSRPEEQRGEFMVVRY